MLVQTERFPRRRNCFCHLDGKRCVSVTTALQTLAKPALVPWAARTAAEAVLEDPEAYDTAEKAAVVIYRKRDTAADRGSLIQRSLRRVSDRSETLKNMVGARGLEPRTSTLIRGALSPPELRAILQGFPEGEHTPSICRNRACVTDSPPSPFVCRTPRSPLSAAVPHLTPLP